MAEKSKQRSYDPASQKMIKKAQDEDAKNLDGVDQVEPGDGAPEASLSLEDQAKAEWDKSADLQREFSGNFDAYRAYKKSVDEGLVKIYGNREVKDKA